MSLPVSPQGVTIYDVVKDLGFPVAVSLILLFQIGPKLDSVLSANAQLQAQLSVVIAECGKAS
jgi:hypothetical protein